jgi:DNA replication and repair protein RecF
MVCHFSLVSMPIENIAITNFRNLTSCTMEFGPRANVIYGSNGSGKTNLLEAIFTLCLGRSQRGAADPVLIKAQSDFYRLEGEISTPTSAHKLAIAYQAGGRKRITIDTVPARASELYEYSCLVAAGPEDSEILSGPPAVRRLFLDLYLAQLSSRYLADLSDYQRVVVQRNAALRNEMSPEPFDPLLVDYGVRIMLERAAFLNRLSVRATQAYGRITGGEPLRITYEPKVPFDLGVAQADIIAAAFQSELARQSDRERAAQVSLVGPHRDDIAFEICGFPARSHGSQGQWRAAAIALKLGVYELLKEKRGEPPVLLLDEIFAELDSERAARLVESFVDTEQLFLTTAVEPPEALFETARRYRIVAGKVMET